MDFYVVYDHKLLAGYLSEVYSGKSDISKLLQQPICPAINQKMTISALSLEALWNYSLSKLHFQRFCAMLIS